MMFYNEHIHDKMLHNYLPYSSASYNLMPKEVMELVELSITKPFHDLYAFNYRVVKFIGVIKDLVVSLSHLQMKSILMDVVIVDITPKYGMLLSRSCTMKMRGTLQMDYSYAIILMFGGETRQLYKEVQLAYLISEHQNPSNHPLYVVRESIDSCVLHFHDQI